MLININIDQFELRTEGMRAIESQWQLFADFLFSEKKLFLKILQHSQKNDSVGAFRSATLLERDPNTGCFSQVIAKFLRTAFFRRTPPVVASEMCFDKALHQCLSKYSKNVLQTSFTT